MTTCYCEIDSCVLCEARLYPGLTPEQVCHIRGLLIRQTYDARDVLFRDGDPAGYLFAVRSGQIKLISSLPDGRQQILHLVVAGQLLGREAFNNRPYAYTAEALTEVNVCKISSRDLQQVLEQNPSMSLRVIQTLIQELDQTEMLIRDLGLKTAPEKVAYVYYGKLLVNGDPNSMKREEIESTNRRLEIVCQPLMAALTALRDAPYVDDVSVFGQALHIRLRDVPPEPTTTDSLAAFTGSARRATVMDVLRKRLVDAGIEVQSVRSVYPSLEDIFVSFTRKMDQSALLL